MDYNYYYHNHSYLPNVPYPNYPMSNSYCQTESTPFYVINDSLQFYSSNPSPPSLDTSQLNDSYLSMSEFHYPTQTILSNTQSFCNNPVWPFPSSTSCVQPVPSCIPYSTSASFISPQFSRRSSESEQSKSLQLRTQKRFKESDRQILYASYSQEPHPSLAAYQQIAKQLNVQVDRVQQWFKNRRYTDKKKRSDRTKVGNNNRTNKDKES
ncbi:unnamed protein product [Didymodactylos carnosus]|uniref:Homeobox domain-containing protein n=1 Tax=Didymodactylos carnosus TaxID=1234261 RepID=A0A813PQS1_9BILA|nr:unnamed protein product [Didymodactylos carnosus]CAF0754718.1 unnamed protein product [Didymodactylos carnosus]CAF3496758.1 unnamed protein product [Didymodactylos carnosus]CAF3534932.1 unnamed protein product [Didymodactylos carnosus]